MGWWRKTNWILDALASEGYTQRLQLMFDHQCALVGVPGLTDDSYQDVKTNTSELMPLLLKRFTPWMQAGGDTDSAITDLINEYKKTIGDPDDPKFRELLMKDLAEQERRRLESQATVESDVERIDRLTAERDARNAERLKGKDANATVRRGSHPVR